MANFGAYMSSGSGAITTNSIYIDFETYDSFYRPSITKYLWRENMMMIDKYIIQNDQFIL